MKKTLFSKIRNLFDKRKIITEEMNIQNEWYAEAEKMEYKNLFKFINKLVKKYKHDYGTICHAMTAGAVATIYAMNKTEQGGITGFQAGCIMWQFIRKFMNKKGFFRLIQYDDMLYPQYEESFGKTISKEVFAYLQEKAKELYNKESAADEVKEHWKKIIEGIVPFGYTIEKE